jgi:heme exporter protein B
MMRLMTAAWAVVYKDLKTESRTRELVGVMLLFALLSVMIFSFALELDRLARREAVSGVLWVTVVYASVLGLNRSMAQERENGSIDALLIAPVPRVAVFWGKFISSFLFTAAIGLLLLPLITILYNLTVLNPLVIVLLLVGTWGICVTGTVLSAMTVQARGGEALLPVALLPIVLPIVIGMVRATTGVLNDAPAEEWVGWIPIVVLIDAVYTVISAVVFGYIVEE